jgi:hypothetical protein
MMYFIKKKKQKHKPNHRRLSQVLKPRASVVVLQVKLPALTRAEQFEPFPIWRSSRSDFPFAHS